MMVERAETYDKYLDSLLNAGKEPSVSTKNSNFIHEAAAHEPDNLFMQLLPRIERIAGQFARRYSSLRIEKDDYFQEASIAVMQALDQYQECKGSLEAFVDTVARNAMYTHIRDHRKTFESKLSEDHRLIRDKEWQSRYAFYLHDTDHMSPEQICLRKEKFERVHQALDAVTPRERCYLWHRFGFDGERERTTAEIAEQFCLSEGVAKKLEKTAVAHVREAYEWKTWHAFGDV